MINFWPVTSLRAVVSSALRPLAPKLRVTLPWVGSSLIPTVGVVALPSISIPLFAVALTALTLPVKSLEVATLYWVRFEIPVQWPDEECTVNFNI